MAYWFVSLCTSADWLPYVQVNSCTHTHIHKTTYSTHYSQSVEDNAQPNTQISSKRIRVYFIVSFRHILYEYTLFVPNHTPQKTNKKQFRFLYYTLLRIGTNASYIHVCDCLVLSFGATPHDALIENHKVRNADCAMRSLVHLSGLCCYATARSSVCLLWNSFFSCTNPGTFLCVDQKFFNRGFSSSRSGGLRCALCFVFKWKALCLMAIANNKNAHKTEWCSVDSYVSGFAIVWNLGLED